MTPDRIRQVVLEVLSDWSLYEEADRIAVVKLYQLPARWFVGYYTADQSHLLGLQLNFDERRLYLLEIELPEFLRGHGHGSSLYDRVMEIARRFEMKEVRQTPSGWTYRGESRENWLLRRGWSECEDGREVFKLVDAT